MFMLMSEVTSITFRHILFIESESLDPACPQGRALHKGTAARDGDGVGEV